MSPLPWIVSPLVGALIGYATNYLAVRMIFRPEKPVNVLGIKIQGLLAKRQRELAESIGRVVGDHLVRHEDVVKALDALDIEGLAGKALDRGLEPKLAELRRMPLVGAF